MADAAVHTFGIRHHGPGSARSLRRSLEALAPDCVLVEGPPDADVAGVVPLLTHKEMKPPAALLVYAADEPARAVYYPFAVFSPEWQAIDYALRLKVALKFIDLPQSHRMAMEQRDAADAAAEAKGKPSGDGDAPKDRVPAADLTGPNPIDAPPLADEPSDQNVRRDPLGSIALAAGYDDGERWWEHMVETRRGDEVELFAAILEMMSAIRERSPFAEEPLDLLREAHMRQGIRAARKEGYKKIAVVCGAWHAPVLANLPDDGAADTAALKGLPKTKVNVTWVPWTYSRLSTASGYGAGVTSPGWYHHLWQTQDDAKARKAAGAPTSSFIPRHSSFDSTVRWMTRVAHLLRGEDLEASPASVIEAVRLAESLAALRACPVPGLPELNEACTTVFCFGSDVPLRLIHRRLIVGELLGAVPDDTPMVPLQADLQREQKRLRLAADAAQKSLDLDLRKPNDLDRSRLLHRLALLGVDWGESIEEHGGKGTFHEVWKLQWEPEYSVRLIEMAVWGNTVAEAAIAFARDRADKAPHLPSLTELLDQVVLADLPEAVRDVMGRLEAQAALASDVSHLMGALPALANVLRYGNVRQTDTKMIGHVVDGLVARICIGLPPATASMNDEAAAEMFERVLLVNDAITLLQNDEYTKSWQDTLRVLADREGLHGLLAGRAVRLLMDAGRFDADEAARRLGLALSAANEPARSAAWIEGFLKGSGLLLLHGEAVWQVLDDWLTGLKADVFTQVLPLLRRTFSTFDPPERRQMGERAKKGAARPLTAVRRSGGAGTIGADFDTARAEAVLPLLQTLLGIN